MPSPFVVTAASNTVLLNDKRQGSTAFTVSNASGRALRGRALIMPVAPTDAAWLTLAGAAERAYAIAATEQVTVQVAVPTTAAAGSYSFHLDVVGEVPDEEYTTGPTVTFTVAAPPPPKKFPWWIVAVVAGVIVLATVAVLMLRNSEARSAASATATVAAAMTRTAADATATAQAQATIDAQATVDAQATIDARAPATAVVQATETAVAVAMGKYVGTWVAQEPGAVYLTKLGIARDGKNLQLNATGKAQIVLINGNLASQVCPPGSPNSECTWGTATVPYTGDPVVFEIQTQPGLKHRITLSVTPDGATLTALNQTFQNNALKGTTTTAFRRQRIIPPIIVLTPPIIVIDPNRIQPEVVFTPAP